MLAGIAYLTVSGQPRIEDQGVIGGNNKDVFTCMYLTNDSGLIVGGYSNSNKSDQKKENSRGYNDYWIIKLDSNRTLQWDKTIGGTNDDYLFALQQTGDGGYILGGYSSSPKSGEKTEISRNFSNDYWIVKLDVNGTLQWDKTIGGNGDDVLSALQQTTDGGYLLGGSSQSGKSGDRTGVNRGQSDYWIVKLDAGGNIQWDKAIGGNQSDNLRAMYQTSDGGYIFGGGSSSFISGEKTENSRGFHDYWIVKVNKNGKIEWDKTIGTKGSESCESIQQTSDGGYILGGGSSSDISDEKTENSRGYRDYWIVKLDAVGNIQWDKTIGGSGYETLREIAELTKNTYILGGSSASGISGDKTGGNRTSGKIKYDDYWLVELRYFNENRTIITQLYTQTQRKGAFKQ